MGIERLNKAVSAAGYAMATPDDEPTALDSPEPAHEAVASRALVPVPAPQRSLTEQAQSTVSGWLKGYLPGFGGRQPA